MVVNTRPPADCTVLVRVKSGDMYWTSMGKLHVRQSDSVGVAVANRLYMRTRDGADHEVEAVWGTPDEDGKLVMYGEISLEHPAGEMNPVILKPNSTARPSQEDD